MKKSFVVLLAVVFLFSMTYSVMAAASTDADSQKTVCPKAKGECTKDKAACPKATSECPKAKGECPKAKAACDKKDAKTACGKEKKCDDPNKVAGTKS
jgi:hypothetical protein